MRRVTGAAWRAGAVNATQVRHAGAHRLAAGLVRLRGHGGGLRGCPVPARLSPRQSGYNLLALGMVEHRSTGWAEQRPSPGGLVLMVSMLVLAKGRGKQQQQAWLT